MEIRSKIRSTSKIDHKHVTFILNKKQQVHLGTIFCLLVNWEKVHFKLYHTTGGRWTEWQTHPEPKGRKADSTKT